MNNNGYKVPKKHQRFELDVKKSRFIADVFCVTSKENVREKTEQLKQEFPDARHHCLAYLIGSPKKPIAAGFSDDGEPNGTAGKPIFNVIQHKALGDVLVIVTRYFGGIKLGAGGLVRSYSAVTTSVLESLECIEKKILIKYSVLGDYAFEQPLRHQLAIIDGHIIDVNYEFGVEYLVNIPQEKQTEFQLFVDSFKFECKTD